MKKIILTALVMSAIVSAPATADPAPIFNWTGFYAGVHGGYAWGENKFTDNVSGLSGKFDPVGGFGGLQIGYNSQFAPHWLIGGEFDLSFGDLSDKFSVSPAALTFNSGTNKVDLFGTARTRFGYVHDRSLLYVTGCVAWMHEKVNLNHVTLGGPANTMANQYSVGWVIGGGWEYAIDNRWSAKLEYLYASFDKTIDSTSLSGTRTFDPNLSTVRVGLNYRFGDAPVASAMPVKARAVRSAWDGGYLGVHGGYGWMNYRDMDTTVSTSNIDPDGAFGGFQSGANWMMTPNWLFGLETDASYGNLDASGLTSGGVPITAKIQGLGTLRARIGYVVDNTLLYVTGGGAYAHEKSTTIPAGSFTSKENLFGWALGSGVEYKFAPEWSAKLEYLYMDFGRNSFDSINFLGRFPRNTELTGSTVKVGLNYSGTVIERFFGGR